MGVVCSYFTASLMNIVFGATRFDTVTNVVTFLISNALTIWLFYAMWRGRQWARWTIAALLGLAVIFVLVTAINDFNWKLGLFVAYQALLPVFLSFPESVDAFIDEQKRKREVPNQLITDNSGELTLPSVSD